MTCEHNFRQKMKVQRVELGYKHDLKLNAAGYFCTKCLLEVYSKEELEKQK